MSRQPNIVLIVPDQMRGDAFGSAGQPAVLTPNLDALAAGGAWFTRAYSPCPSCIAARRCLLSGRTAFHNGLVGYKEGVTWKPPFTLPGLLAAAGYQSVHIGRTMHQHPHSNRFGYTQVFDEQAYLEFIAAELPGGRRQLSAHGIGVNGWPARPWHVAERFHQTNWAVDRTLDFLEARRGKRPLFLSVGFSAPHPPLTPPAFYFDRYLRQALPAPVVGEWAEPPGAHRRVESERVHLTGEALRSCQAGYFGLINHLDDQLSRLLSGLSGLSGETYVFFLSDHGEMLGDHYLFRKCFPYEGAARIPFLLCGPGIPAGFVSDQPVGLEDVLPTALELAGLTIPGAVDGRSLLPLLRGQPAWREYYHGEHAKCYASEHGNHFLTDGRAKYCWYAQSGREQLFDLVNDPHETRDLAGDGARVSVWRKRLIQELKKRPEGFTDGKRLRAGRPYPAVVAA
ncbi:MAG: Arylsulfatase [Verrucomicrobiae bacterium]|nr:Arylsulfatase [Verrucomicrobiae bacterium]